MINTAKERMLNGKQALGIEVGLGSAFAAELLAPLNYDYVLVDNQHGKWDETDTFNAFRSIALGSNIPIARVQQNDFGAIGRLLDIGALGIVGPMVNNVKEAQDAVKATRYPPIGSRSGGAFGVNYHGYEDYMASANDEILLAIQIETAEGFENREAIMSTEGIDGCWIGPHDLAFSMSLTFGEKAHTEAISSIIETCKKTNKISGISTGSPEVAQPWLDKGCQFVTVAGDAGLLVSAAEENLRKLGRM